MIIVEGWTKIIKGKTRIIIEGGETRIIEEEKGTTIIE